MHCGLISAACMTQVMTEKEKMQHEQLYDANNDAALVAERTQAKDLCYDFNSLRPSETEKQAAILEKLLGSKGKNCAIMAPFWCDYGYNIHVGDNFFANHNTVILDGAPVTFGDNVFIAPNCGFYTAGHPVDCERRNAGLEYAYAITVGSNVWIGAAVHVLPGISAVHLFSYTKQRTLPRYINVSSSQSCQSCRLTRCG